MTLEGNEAEKLPYGSKDVEPSKLWMRMGSMTLTLTRGLLHIKIGATKNSWSVDS